MTAQGVLSAHSTHCTPNDSLITLSSFGTLVNIIPNSKQTIDVQAVITNFPAGEL